MRSAADFDPLLAAYKHYAAARGGNSAKGRLSQGRTRTDADHCEYLLTCDQDSGREGGGSAGKYHEMNLQHVLT